MTTFNSKGGGGGGDITLKQALTRAKKVKHSKIQWNAYSFEN
jgi:hypothetical protein